MTTHSFTDINIQRNIQTFAICARVILVSNNAQNMRIIWVCETKLLVFFT